MSKSWSLPILVQSCLFCSVLIFSNCQQVQATPPPPSTSEQSSSIEEVINQVKQALADVQTKLSEKDLPALKQVKLSLQTTVSKKGGLTLKFWIINIGGTYEKDRAQQIDIVLTPPSAGNARLVGTESFTQNLEDAIISAVEGVNKASTTGTFPLNFSSLDVQLKFTVKSDASGGVGNKITIIPITADFSGDLSKTSVQTLTISFASNAK